MAHERVLLNATGLRHLAEVIENLDDLDMSFNGIVTVNLADRHENPLDISVNVVYHDDQKCHQVALG
jgi:hypothetical protein